MDFTKAACIAHMRRSFSSSTSEMSDDQVLEMYDCAQTLTTLSSPRNSPPALDFVQQSIVAQLRALLADGGEHLSDTKLYGAYDSALGLLSVAAADGDLRIPTAVENARIDRWRKVVPGGEGMSYDEVYDAFEAEVRRVVQLKDRKRAKQIVKAISPRVKDQ